MSVILLSNMLLEAIYFVLTPSMFLFKASLEAMIRSSSTLKLLECFICNFLIMLEVELKFWLISRKFVFKSAVKLFLYV